MRVITYSMICDNRGVQHYVGEDGRSLCGYIYGRNATYFGFELTGEEWSYPDDCPQCSIQLVRFHGPRAQVPTTHDLPF